VSMSKTLTP